MLFSREDVAAFIDRNFEAAWETVRPVPIVRIDFGNGNVSTRTLHGNVASYVCTGEGQVADILPGIYTPGTYTRALAQPLALAISLSRLEPAPRLTSLRAYHGDRAQALRNQAAMNAAQAQLITAARGGAARLDRDIGKGRIERRVEQIVQIPAPAQQAPRPRTAAELANWQPLAADTVRNETERRLLIHERFAGADAVRPEQIKRWLYRDVLHADLDDPHLGLGEDFFTDLER